MTVAVVIWLVCPLIHHY